MKHLSYTDFYRPSPAARRTWRIAKSGHARGGENKNVMCFIEAIYIYLRARCDTRWDADGRRSTSPSPPRFTKAENRAWA